MSRFGILFCISSQNSTRINSPLSVIKSINQKRKDKNDDSPHGGSQGEKVNVEPIGDMAQTVELNRKFELMK